MAASMQSVRRCFALILPAAFLLFPASGPLGRTLRVDPLPGAADETLAGGIPFTRECACDSLRADSILYTLELPGVAFTFGDTVRMAYRITNERAEPVTFTFPTTCHDWFGVYPEGCGPLDPDCPSTWHAGWGCYQMFTDFTLDPGQTKEFVLNWRQHTDEGYRAPSGSYAAWGSLQSPDYFEPLLLSVPFRIDPYGPEPIQEALDAAGPGDTVLVAPGVYRENVVLLERHAGVVLRAEGAPDATILDGDGRGSAIYAHGTGDATRIEGFTITNGVEGQGRELYAAGVLGGGVTILEAASPAITGNVLRGNRGERGGGIACNGSARPLVSENLFLENEALETGGGFFAGFRGGGAMLHLSGNTFAYNRAAEGGAVFDDGGLSRLEVRACIFYGNTADQSGGGLVCFGAYNQTINDCNAFWANEPDDMTDCSVVTHAVLADPRFCDPESDDFHLRDESPCAPLNNPACGLIGAFGVGCLTASVGEGEHGRSFGAAPNPFRLAVTLEFPGVASRPAVIAVTDARGRVVSRRTLPAGAERLLWDGRDEGGRMLPSGVYFLRATRDGTAIGRMTLVRIE